MSLELIIEICNSKEGWHTSYSQNQFWPVAASALNSVIISALGSEVLWKYVGDTCLELLEQALEHSTQMILPSFQHSVLLAFMAPLLCLSY